MNELEYLLNKHQQLIEDLNLMSIRVRMPLPLNITYNTELEPRIVANMACSFRETEIRRKMNRINECYLKYKKYSEYQPREIVISYTLYSLLKEDGVCITRVFK